MGENQLISRVNAAYIYGSVGGTTGDLWGIRTVKNEAGQVVIGADGNSLITPELQYCGSVYPAWRAGWNNEFVIKNFRISFSFDGQKGGLIYSQTHHKLTELGKLSHTLDGRLPGTPNYIAGDDPRIAAAGLQPIGGLYIVGEGVVENPDGSYSPNERLITARDWYERHYRLSNVETNSFDASYIKLREARIEFNVPSRLLDGIFIERASVALYGRNLYTWSSFPIFDPETSAVHGDAIVPGIEMGQLPTPRSFGINFNFIF